jgi:hypothetical protein
MCVRFGYYNYFVLFVVIVCSLGQVIVPKLSRIFITVLKNCAEMFYVRSLTNDPSLIPVGQINWAASGASRDIFYGPLTL